MKHILGLVAHLLTLAAATDCVPGSDSCDDSIPMKVSMLQKKQINALNHEGETISSLEERKASLLAELESLDSQIASLDEETQDDEEEQLHEDPDNHTYTVAQGTSWCSPDKIGRRREDPSADGGRCSCRRRDGMSSTGMYGCQGGWMEYYGGGDADSRRRGWQPPSRRRGWQPPSRRRRSGSQYQTWWNKNCYTENSDNSYHGAYNIGGSYGNIGEYACKQHCDWNGACDCVTVGGKGECYLRRNCQYGSCADGGNYWNTYQKR